jgi:RimJ/RimL family protein N-acetyltransferase
MTIRHATLLDVEFIQSLYRDHDIAKYMVDDNAGVMSAEFIEAAIRTPYIFCLIVEQDGNKAGMFLFVPWNMTTYELQSAFLKEYRGSCVMAAGYQVRKWFFEKTKALKCIAMIPKGNYPCQAAVRHMGFIQEGINRKSYLHDGVLYDQYLYGLCKEDVKE